MFQKLLRPKYTFIALMVLSALVYLTISFVLGPRMDPSLLDADEREYYDLAGLLINGTYEFNARRTPAFVFVMALMRLVTRDSLIAIQMIVTTLFSLSAPLLYLLVKRTIGDRRVAVVAALFVVLWPPFWFYGRTLYSETVALPAFIGFLLLLPCGSRLTAVRDSIQWRCLIAGAAFGLCMLLRPMYLLFSPFAIAILFLEEARFRTALKRAVWLTIGCAFTVLPWSIFITLQTGTPILLSANGGETLAGGLNPVWAKTGYQEFTTSDGRRYWAGPGKWLADSENGYLQPEDFKLPYIQRDKLLRQRTIAWVLQHPGQAMSIQCSKLLYMWGFFPFWQGLKQTLGGNVPSIIALLLGMVSLIRFRQYWRELSRFWVLPIFVSSVALVSWGSWRFRQPGDIGLLVLCALFVLSLAIQPAKLMKVEKQVLSQPEKVNV